MNMLDLFCGTGALSYGIEKNSQIRTVGGIDADKAACATAALNHQNAKIICKEIQLVAPREMLSLIGVGQVDLIVGGPPCQGFSSLRPSRGVAGLDDPRNSLYKNFLGYVRELRPRVFLMENVVGILSAGDGALVTDMLQSFRRLGYSVDWKILNAANFGVPQKRERFFLLGTRKNLGRKVVPHFPVPKHWFQGRVIGTRLKDHYVVNQSMGLSPVTVRDAISDLPSLKSGEAKSRYKTPPSTDYQLARRCKELGTLTLHEAAAHNAKMLNVIKHSGASISALPKGLVSSGYSSCYSRLNFDEPATTITVKFTSPASSKCIHPVDNRAITPREAARIQSFDDAFSFAGSKTEIASQIGNAVPPLFGEAFSEVLEEIIESQGIGEY